METRPQRKSPAPHTAEYISPVFNTCWQLLWWFFVTVWWILELAYQFFLRFFWVEKLVTTWYAVCLLFSFQGEDHYLYFYYIWESTYISIYIYTQSLKKKVHLKVRGKYKLYFYTHTGVHEYSCTPETHWIAERSSEKVIGAQPVHGRAVWLIPLQGQAGGKPLKNCSLICHATWSC